MLSDEDAKVFLQKYSILDDEQIDLWLEQYNDDLEKFGSKNPRGVIPAHEILELIDSGELYFEGDSSKNLCPNGLDLTLSDTFRIFRDVSPLWVYDEKMINSTTMINKSSIHLLPTTLVLGSTKEKIGIPSYITATLEGRSSVGRCGIFVHISAGRIDAGFGWDIDSKKRGKTLTLEIVSLNPSEIILEHGMRICQITFQYLSKPTLLPYFIRKGSKYLAQEEATSSRLYLDDERKCTDERMLKTRP